MLAILLLSVLFHTSSAVIYELTVDDWLKKKGKGMYRTHLMMKPEDAEYALMPPKFLLDDYEACLADPEGLYCQTKLALVSDKPSPLLIMIQELSEHKTTHYNHTQVYRGVCITQTCKKFYEKSEGDLGSVLEACANETTFNKYKLKTRVSNDFHCSKREKNQPIDYVDTAVAVVCVGILVVNIMASICDYIFEKGTDSADVITQGNSEPSDEAHCLRYLYCFSIFRNWNKLVAPATGGREPQLDVLKGLNGIRALNMVIVIVGHSIGSTVFLIENPKFIESMFITDFFHIFLNGTLIMQTFLVISSFLFVYMMQIHSEKHEPSWTTLPKQFLMRWLRLTPPYAVILALTATWFGRLTSGPFWQYAVGDEMADCRRYWWLHLLYLNNYFDKSQCMGQAWYLAADFQLYCMATIIFVMCRTPRTKKMVLSFLFVLGVVIPTLKTYYLNLAGVMVISPELALDIFRNSPSFHEIYIRGHTNIAGYVLGMALGYWFYDWQKAGGDPKTFRRYNFLYWTLAPLLSVCCYSGTIFYAYSAAPSMTVNLLYAAFMKPIFAFLICLIIGGVITQFEDIYRTVLEWPVWTIPSRLSFGAYLLHIPLLSNFIAMQTTTYRVTALVIIAKSTILVTSSFISGFFFWILIENPFRNVVRECLTTPEENKELNTDSEKNNEDGKVQKKI